MRGTGAVSALIPRDPDPAYRRRCGRLLEFLDLRRGQRILDLGCGLGFFLVVLENSGARSFGGDRSLGRALHARKVAPASPLVVGDALRTPFASESFDGVVLGELIEHLPDDRAALAEAFRLLRPGGTLVLSVPHADFPFWWDPVARVRGWLGWSPIRSGRYVGIWFGHQRLYRPGELRDLLEKAGFEIDEIDECTHRCLPFHHFLIYGVGKPIVEGRWLPKRWRQALDRSRSPGSSRPPALLAALQRVADWVDRRNDRPAGLPSRSPKTFVNIVLKAHRSLS